MKRANGLLMLLLMGCSLGAQTVTNINPANVSDPRTIFANPAFYNANLPPFIIAGYQNLHSGLTARLSHTMIGFYYPMRRWGALALTVPGFQSPHFTQSGVELRYALPIHRAKSVIGVNAGTVMTFYNIDDHQLIDANDPLLFSDQSINALNIGLGITSRPLPYLTLALTADHVNRPVMSFQGGMRRDVHYRLAAMGEYKGLHPMLMWEREEGLDYWALGAEYWFSNLLLVDGALVRAFRSSENLTLGAGLIYRNLRLDYIFDYPLSTFSAIAGGSHQLVATFSLNRTAPCEPPVAVIRAMQDTLQRWLPHTSLREHSSSTIRWQTVNSFVVNSQAYEILNPQANPFANFCFFDQGSDRCTELPENLLDLVDQYKKDYMARGDTLVLRGFINGGRQGACDGSEQDPELAKRRAAALKKALQDYGIKDDLFADKTDSDPRFARCIEQEMVLKEERQRVHLFIAHDGQQRRLPLLFTKKMSTNALATFDVSESKAPCGWQRWIAGLWQFADAVNPILLWSARGNTDPGELLSWEWQKSLADDAPMNNFLRVKLSVKGVRHNPVISETDSLYVQQFYRPTRLLILFNFDRYSEILGEGLNPENNPERQSSYDGSCDALRELDEREAKLLESSLKPVIEAALEGKISIQSIIGHTDNVGDTEHNLTLSKARALAVKCYLQEHGVDVPALVQGRGESEPISSNDTPAGRWLNRRVEVVIEYHRP